MIPYLLHVALLLTVCLLFYKLLLQTETFYRLNRWVLLGCLSLSFLLPLIPVPGKWSIREVSKQQFLESHAQVIVFKTVTNDVQAVVAPAATKPVPAVIDKSLPIKPSYVKPSLAEPLHRFPIEQWVHWMFVLYWVGVAIFGLNLLIQLCLTLYQAYNKPAITDGPYRIIELSGDKVPCSFLNNIFINPEKYDWETYKQILSHEKVHVRQFHSLDILIAELAIVFQWFNPFAWLYRKEVENNLEYLTDEEVLINETTDKESYQVSLLKVSTPHFSLRIATNYNQSLLKKRIIMMNAKKSNLHTLWKYFMLLPLFGCLAFALNEPANSKNLIVKNKANVPVIKSMAVKEAMPGQDNFPDDTEGNWFATIKHDKLYIDFKNIDDDHNWSSSSSFPLSDFSTLPKEQKGDFTLTRDAGTITFNGKFDGDQGYGHYKFTGNHTYTSYLKNAGVENTEDRDLLTFLMLNISKSYLKSLQENGFTSLSKGQLISMAALKVDAAFISGWKQAGFKDITPSQLVSAKAMHIDSAYVREIQKAGYPNITFQQLVSFKAQGVTGSFVSGFRKAGQLGKSGVNVQSHSGSSASTPMTIPMEISVNEVSSAKALQIDSAYVKSFAKVGYENLQFHELTSFKVMGVTADYIKSLQDVGYTNLPARSIISLKTMRVTPEFIKGFNDIGYKNIPLSSLTSFKIQGVTPEFIKGFEDIGYKNLEPSKIISLKIQGVTLAFVKGFRDLGYTDVPLSDITYMKIAGVTPEYVAAMKQKGLNSKDLRKYATLKNSFN